MLLSQFISLKKEKNSCVQIRWFTMAQTANLFSLTGILFSLRFDA
ncbi:hypothetical protein LEP1GSC062_2753 [Leptospira alexanderi serovar Manhao 3 str. L 60]|uniref:Uncharacterized protein n=1 Tax=Leptospira alexanderi serovar Manhao 3 str. L 60 TaxID=1049759 RepID=V6I3N6_9LEPT|nr:hypothetical protein LEP1GSC062_2753 [Leptospira alexanderi serovar Manhao 3 str. L 60]